MALAEDFVLDYASVIGKLHVDKHVNNQDSFDIFGNNEDFFIAVVADGCSGSPHSEVGAYLTTAFLGKELVRWLPDNLNVPIDFRRVLEESRMNTASFLRSVASMLGHPAEYYLQDAMLSTASGFVVTPATTCVFSIGDGVFFVNNEEVHLSNDQAEYPDMLAYGAMNPESLKIAHSAKFEYVVYDTEVINSILVATDGFRYVLNNVGNPMPGVTALVPPLREIIQSPIKPLLYKMSKTVTRAHHDRKLDVVTQTVAKSMLWDDTTVVILRRRDTDDQGREDQQTT